METPTISTTTYVVLSPFRIAPGVDATPGQIVETRDWPYGRAKQLADMRYLAPSPVLLEPANPRKGRADG